MAGSLHLLGSFEMQLSSVALGDGDGFGRVGMVSNDTKGSEFEFRHRAVEFCEVEGTIVSSGDDNHRPKISRTTLSI